MSEMMVGSASHTATLNMGSMSAKSLSPHVSAVNAPRQGELVVYGCGGCGINMASRLITPDESLNYAKVRSAFVDASKSNLKPEFRSEDIFILPNVDGSGKIRKENHREIANSIKQVLLQIEPGDFNIVIFSASGGSGSVIGPLLLGELLDRGLTACCMVVGSDESIITASNTLNTLKSLEAIARKVKLPVVMYYESNDREKPRSEVDAQINLIAMMLSVLASRQNREMDTKDLANWVQFSKTTTVEPQLALLEVFNNGHEANQVKDPISIASIYVNEDIEPLTTVPEYSATGYLNDMSTELSEIHFIISIDAIPTIVGTVRETLDRYLAQRDGRIKTGSFLTEKDQPTEEGLIL